MIKRRRYFFVWIYWRDLLLLDGCFWMVGGMDNAASYVDRYLYVHFYGTLFALRVQFIFFILHSSHGISIGLVTDALQNE